MGTDNVKKVMNFKSSKNNPLTDEQLDMIAGGKDHDWFYTEDVLEYDDPKNPGKKIIKEGYRITGLNRVTGGLLRTQFVTKEKWKQFIRAHDGDNFYEGDPCPGN